MSVEMSLVGGCLVVTVVGGIAPDAAGRVSAAAAGAPVIIDVSALPAARPRAMTALVAAVGGGTAPVAVVDPRPPARSRFGRWRRPAVPVFPSVEAAVAALAAGPAAGAAWSPGATGPGALRHEALLHAGEAEFTEAALDFVWDALACGDPVVVAVTAPRLDALRAALGPDADLVWFADMAELGVNPARILPELRTFVTGHVARGRRPRGLGEPVWPGRSPAEVAECQVTEALLSVALADTTAWLRCAYDTEALDPPVVAEARRTHPEVVHQGVTRPSPAYRPRRGADAPWHGALPDPPADAVELAFRSVTEVRTFTARQAAAAGMWVQDVRDVVRAVAEVATNSVVHGGGRGTLLAWRDASTLLFEVRDPGVVHDPLAGRRAPVTPGTPGQGLWLANQLCDLVQLRSSAAGTVVRLHVRLR